MNDTRVSNMTNDKNTEVHKVMEKDLVVMGSVTLGSGRPKTCVSIIGTTKEAVFLEADKLKESPCDILEWRVDLLDSTIDAGEIVDMLLQLRSIIGDKPLIFTIRTCAEGGQGNYTCEAYKALNIAAISSGLVDMVDVELLIGDVIVSEIIDAAHKADTYVIASNHDFHQTPSREEIVKRLMQMDEKGADVLKIAVMPQNSKDVLTLLEATREVYEERTGKPIVTMSMSKLGMISRMAGETFGSAMTFGAGDQASAPGQMPVAPLVEILEILHT